MHLHRSLAAALLLLAAWPALADQPVRLVPGGVGQALVYPWYTANGGQDTLLTLTNLEEEAKAVKLRFLEGRNSRQVLDVNVYLGPGDVWTGAVTAAGEGARLVSRDATCTVPAFTAANGHALPFTTAAFDGSGAQGADRGPKTVGRVREGHIEVVEMGVVVGASATALGVPGGRSPLHAVGGVPTGCARLQAAWGEDGYWSRDSTTDLAPPRGGIAGAASIVAVAEGTVIGYQADALTGFHVEGEGLEHTPPGALTPNLSSATARHAIVEDRAGGAPRTLEFDRGIDAVTAVFMKRTLTNEFWTAPEIGARSEWVVTYPTKRFYTDPYYVNAARQPFRELFAQHAPGEPSRSCSPAFAFFLSGPEQGRISNLQAAGSSLPTLTSFPKLCHAAQVVGFEHGDAPVDVHDHTPRIPSPVLSAQLVSANFPAEFDSGWALFSFDAAGHLDPRGADWLSGEPVTGFLAVGYVNGAMDGVLANYSHAAPHRSDRPRWVDEAAFGH